MLIPTIVIGIISLILIIIGYFKGEGQHIAGIKFGISLMIEIMPLLILSFIMAGMIKSLVPNEIISKWIGTKSGLKGILIGTIAGGLSPGGPYVNLPVAAALLHAGASVGTMVAYLTGWSLWAISRLPMEIGMLGTKFTLIRLASTFFFPPIAGFIASVLFSD